MNHRVDQASLDAYEIIKHTNTQELNRAIVFDCISDNSPVSDAEIAEILGWKINTVTPRRNELVKLGKIISIGKYNTDLSKVKVNLWRISTVEEKILYFTKQKLDHDKLIKTLKKQGRELAYIHYWGKGEFTPSSLVINAFIGAYLIGKGV